MTRLTDERIYGLFVRSGLSAYHQRDGVVEVEYERKVLAFARAIEAELAQQAEPVARILPHPIAEIEVDGDDWHLLKIQPDQDLPDGVHPVYLAPPLPSAPDTVQVPLDARKG